MLQTDVRQVNAFGLLIWPFCALFFVELIYARRANATQHASTLPASWTLPLPSPFERIPIPTKRSLSQFALFIELIYARRANATQHTSTLSA
jgi:hypothetical protein